MPEQQRAKVSHIRPCTPAVFCCACVFYVPHRGVHRCQHPSAETHVTTFAGYATHVLEPEEKNAQNDCPDFRARTWRDVLARTALFLAGVTLLWTLIFYVFPWLFGG